MLKWGLLGIVLTLGSGAAVAEETGDCQGSRRPEERLRACTAVIASGTLSGSELAAAFRYRAGANAAIGAMKAADADYTEALRLDDSSGPAYAGRGEARVALGKLAPAIADFSDAISRGSKFATVYVSRGYANLASGKVDEALADLTEAIRLDAKFASAYNNRGLAYRKKGDLDQAIADYTTAIDLNPIYALAYNNRGYAHEAKGDKQRAAADFRQALTIDPALTGAREGLKRVGSVDEAVRDSEKLVAAGRALVERNCAWCHAIGPQGKSPNPRAPEFRNFHRRHGILALRDPLTRGIAAPHDEMPKFPPSDAEIDRIIAYINSLRPAD